MNNNGNNGGFVGGPFSLPEGMRRLRLERLTLFHRALLVFLVAFRGRDAERYHFSVCLRDMLG